MKHVKRLLAGLAVLLTAMLFLLPVKTSAANAYVIDETGLFSNEQLVTLNSIAEEISQRQQCGVYVIITKDQHGYRERDFAQGIFMNYDLGYGEKDGASGVLLAIAYEERFFDSVAYGAATDTFTTQNLDRLNDLVLDFLYDGDWYGAARGFIEECDSLLTSTGYHYYVPHYTDPAIDHTTATTSPAQRKAKWLRQLPVAALISFGLALLITALMGMKNKNIGLASEAARYLVKNGINMKVVQDIFINKTRTTTRIHRDSGGGGSSGSSHSFHSSGFSHSSGGHHF